MPVSDKRGRLARMGERGPRGSIAETFILVFSLLSLFTLTASAQQKPASNTLLVCTACHIPKDGKLDSIASVRMTPEGWRMTLSRMVRNHGLALEERNSTLETHDKAGLPANVIGACVQCHSFARIALQRRTPEMWTRVPDLHEYFV